MLCDYRNGSENVLSCPYLLSTPAIREDYDFQHIVSATRSAGSNVHPLEHPPTNRYSNTGRIR